MAAIMLKPQLEELKSDFDYEEYGGAPILGVDGPVIKIHGSSTANAVRNAIIKGIPYGEENVVDIIRQSMLDLEEKIEKDEEE
jgi:glycerol-3-phosphate acyltransferase PlsX